MIYPVPPANTLLPLSRYAQIMQIPLPHFWQLAGNKAPVVKGCGDDSVWDSQNRADLAWIISQAEQEIAIQLGFWPAPKFITGEHAPLGLTGVRGDWRNAELKTEWSHVQGYGAETLTLKKADAAVTYSDSNSDPFGREELATIDVSDVTACDGVCEVAVFFRVADGAEDAADERYEIKPLTVDIDGSSMTITANAAQFVKPTLQTLTKAECKGSENELAWQINYNTSNFVEAVDVYCRTINTQTPATLKWDGYCACTSPCQHETQTACAYPTDSSRGFYVARPATWSGTANIKATPLHAWSPESVMVNYRAGYPLDARSCGMNHNLERAIVRLTNALAPEPPCGFCDYAKRIWEEDREDIDPLTPEAASLPWDLYKKGALVAWRIVKNLARGRGGKLGR